jgi:hypothetical protein
MWATDPNDWPLEAEHLTIIAREAPTDPPCAWSLKQAKEPTISVVHYRDGVVSEITEIPALLLAPPPGTSVDRYASFLRAVARAFPELRTDALAPRLLLVPALVDEASFHRALVDYAYRAEVVHPIWAERIARDAGLPPPEPRTAAVVGAFADSWSATAEAIICLQRAVSEGDRVSGRYVLGLAEALATWRVELGTVARTDFQNRDLDEMLIIHALPLLALAADESTRDRVARVQALRDAMHR